MEHAANSVPGVPGPWRLGRKKIYILPTRQGLAFAGVLVVLLAGSINYNNSLAYGLSFLLTSVALVSMIHTYRNLAGLIISTRPAADVFAGTPAYYPISIDNPGELARQGVVLRHHARGEEAVVAVEIPASSRPLATLAVPARERGWQILDQVTLATRAPLGIFRAWSPVPLAAPVLVYPAPAGRQPLPPRQGPRPRESGGDGQGRDDFSALREYRPGDPPKRIHWKLAARGEALPVKLFDGASGGDLILREADVLAPDPEARLGQLCAWILEAESRGLEYGLELGAERIPPGTGPRHRRQCLRRLALHGSSAAPLP